MNVSRTTTTERFSLNVLLVDDDATQLKLTALRLRAEGFSVETAGGAEDALCKAKAKTPHAIMSDVLMGDIDGFALCRMLRAEKSLDAVPIILLSAHYQGTPDQQLATHVGACALVARTADFDAELIALRTSLLTGSKPGVEPNDVAMYEQHLRSNASQIHKLLERAVNAEGRYRTLFQSASDLITVLTPDGYILDVNDRCQALFGFAPSELIGKHISEFAAPGSEEYNNHEYEQSIEARVGRASAVPIRRADGQTIYVEFSNSLIDVEGKPTVLAIGRDVTATVIAAQRLAAAEEKYRTVVERIPDAVWTTTVDGRFVFVSPNAEKVFGDTLDILLTEDLETRMGKVHPDDRELISANAFRDGGGSFDVEYRRRRSNGQYCWIHNRATAVYERNGVRYIEGMATDITERKRLEEIVRQSQKMEAVGQLSGGIAHDFNNILAVILANSQFLIEDIAEHDPRQELAVEIKAASERAAALTRQLLAFSRHQILQPTIVNLNTVVGGIEKMLRRLIGEDIDVAVIPASDLGSTRLDVGQIEQLIMNLVVNARDAMPTGGRITIETANVELDEEQAAVHQSKPGSYVMLAVSDTGCGMDAETRRRIFEPFFTTKEVGKGTGLGLSTCYGIARQSGGAIFVYSEVGRGSAFKVYLPRTNERPELALKVATSPVPGGGETILIVEDDDRVRGVVHRILGARGYRLLIANSPQHALDLAARHVGSIDLVLSDVVMPGMSGPDAVDQLRARFPKIRALYMSGYTDHAVLRNGTLTASVNFVQKPFSNEVLAKKIRQVLDS